MPKRIPTPEPGDDEPKYYTVVQPYPLHANWELPHDYITCGRWIAGCIGPDTLPFTAILYKPSARGQIIIEIDRNYPEPERLLGEHRWSEFLKKPNAEEQGRVSQIFYSTYATGRQAQKDGWKRINVADSWFTNWNPVNPVIAHPYPPTVWCPPPARGQNQQAHVPPAPRQRQAPACPEGRRAAAACGPRLRLLGPAKKPPRPPTPPPPCAALGPPRPLRARLKPPLRVRMGLVRMGTGTTRTTRAAMSRRRSRQTRLRRGTWPPLRAATTIVVAKPETQPAPASASSSAPAFPPGLPPLAPPGLTRGGSTSTASTASTTSADTLAADFVAIAISPSMEANLYGAAVADTSPDPGAYVAEWEQMPVADADALWPGAYSSYTSTPLEYSPSEKVENLWGEEEALDNSKVNAKPPNDIVCTVHGIICKKGICAERARLVREKEKADKLAKEREARGWNKAGGGGGRGRNSGGNGGGWEKKRGENPWNDDDSGSATGSEGRSDTRSPAPAKNDGWATVRR
ncbi:hypothetical protein MSAN_01625000 [Mycena sanguinolenta]|uniref:Uncharacterized protein n=1 Tax=Mycena sanguinolenta TaxID=230812 RepID=A0A8H6Y2J6_9AGAR|nr:hypothetical protein MSAN_01625000 [Mycena sanguinolenta]